MQTGQAAAAHGAAGCQRAAAAHCVSAEALRRREGHQARAARGPAAAAAAADAPPITGWHVINRRA